MKNIIWFISMNMERRIALFVLTILYASCFISSAQDVKVSAKADAVTIRIGEQTKLHLKVEAPNDARVTFPVIPDTITKIEIISRGKIDTVKAADGKQT